MKKIYQKGETYTENGHKVYTIDCDDFDEGDFLFNDYICVYSNKTLRDRIIKVLNKYENRHRKSA